MKPGHVNFFDGMRVSAEHMDHLQGSLHSAIADLRAIAGLGRVQHGFDVTSNNDGTVTVGPGLAFDAEGSRIVCAEPRLVTPRFAAGQAAAVVCVEYASNSTGIVDDTPTMIWDGCRITVRPDEPTAGERQVPIARVRPLSDASGFEVDKIGGGHVGAEASASEPMATEAPAAIGVRQGIAQLASDPAGLALSDLSTRIAAAMTDAGSGTGSGTGSGSDVGADSQAVAEEGALGTVSVDVAATEITLDFLWRSLTARGVVDITWSSPGSDPGTVESAAVHGEATFWTEGLSQHSVMTWTGGDLEPGAPRTVVSPDAFGELALSEQMALRIRVVAGGGQGLELRASIEWKGGADEQALRTLADSDRTLAWHATLAWKAMGF